MTRQRLLSALLSAKWLSGVIGSRQPGLGLQVLDIIPYSSKGDSRKEFEEQHIPGALLFDLDECRNKASPFPEMLPSAEEFAKYVGNLGIGNQTHVVVYDRSDVGSFCAPRAWWMFRVFGHNAVSVLDGGFRNWLREGHPVTSEIVTPILAEFRATLNRSWVKTFEDMVENLESKQCQVVDMRAEGRFRGTEAEPRKGITSGHIPGTKNIPYFMFLTESGTMKSEEQLRSVLKENGVDLGKPLVGTCGSGVTACHLALATFLLGKEDTMIYDGSWSEWFVWAKPEHIISRGKAKGA